MIKIDKDFDDIPASLVVPSSDDTQTNRTRKKMMTDKKYGKYAENCYRAGDVKKKLENIYHHKCAYCEQRVEQYHVEHYRPKNECKKNGAQQHDGYYWISLSWDNLLLACPRCNEYKGSQFDIEGSRQKLGDKELDVNINKWSLEYDNNELPLLINPERDKRDEYFIYDDKGHIKHREGDKRAEYTIETCKLDRKCLCDCRRKIIEKFERDINAELNGNADMSDRKNAVKTIYGKFIRDSNDQDNEFLEFRRYAIKNILPNILRSFNNQP